MTVYSVTFTNPSFTVESGNRLLVIFYTNSTNSDPQYYYGSVYSASTPSGTTSFTVTETAAPSDSTPPTAGTVTVTPDISGTYTSSAPTITTVFTDAESAVTSCQYTTNGSTWTAGAVSGAGPYTCTANPTGLSGSLNINMRATSTGGQGTATQITRTADATVPTDGTLTATPANGQVSLSWTAATDPGGSGIASYILRYAAGATAPANCTAGTAVTGSPYSSATLSAVQTGLTNGTQYSFRLCATDNLSNTSGGATASATPFSDPTKLTSCTSCHFNSTAVTGNGGSYDGTGRNTPAGLFPGSHNGHVVTNGMTCATCHVAPATQTSTDFGHSNGNIQMQTSINGGSYGGGGASIAVRNNPTFSTCNTTTCHGTASPTWGSNTTNASCTKCHGKSGTTPAAYTADTKLAAPGYSSGRDTGGATAATDPQVGAHAIHLAAAPSYSAALACTSCHSNVNTTSTSFTGHMDGAGTVSFSGTAVANSATPSYSSPNCTNTYCHFGKSISGYAPATTNASVSWTNTAYITGTPSLAGDCGKCHASPPLSTGTHAGVTTIAACNGCHSHVNADGTFNDKTLHINGIVEASGSCIQCHATAQTGTHGTPRDAITTEFGLAYGHKKSGRSAVTDSDCIVCHLEGDFATQKAATNGKHKDGNIDLRDPDGAGETAITNNSGAAFTFTKYAVSYAAGSRTTTLGNTVAEVVTVKFCMKCHDSNGATNTTARTRNAGNTATTGTAFSPFEGVNLGANYTTTNGAAAAGGVVDVATQFASTNSSRHPVGAPNSRAYPYSTRLLAPYNNIGTTRDSNTQAANTASPRVKANSVVMVCDDCHTTATTITTRTITAHGSGGTTNMRGTYFVASPTLCTTCHTGVYADNTNGRHNTGSAFAVGTTRAASAMTKCNFCHFSINDATYTAAKRPRWGQDVHGFNNLYGVTTGWTAGAANGVRPVAFMRSWATGGGSWPTTASPRPYVVLQNATTGQGALAAGQSTCGGTFAFNSGSSGVSCSSNGHTNYSPGGSY